MADAAKPARGPGRPFVKGQSGNPAGTSKTPAEVRAFLTEKSLLVAQSLFSRIESNGLDDKDHVAACVAFLRFSVAPPQPEKSGDGGDDVLERLAAALTTKKDSQ